MSSRTLTVRAQLILLAAVSCTLFAIALAVAVWQLQAGGARLSAFIDTELAAEREATRAYAHGLQMGQALRNILLDPANPKAYENFQAAKTGFDDTLARLLAAPAVLDGGVATAARLRELAERWAPLQAQVIERVRAGDNVAAQRTLVASETPAWREVRAELMKRGAVAVDNLKGGIFAWHNQQRPLVSGQGQPTPYVHPFDSSWGKLVDRQSLTRMKL